MDHWELVTEERQALIDLFRTVAPDRWQVPSLCPGWSAHDVVAHLTSLLEAGPIDMVEAGVRGLGRPPVVTRVLARRWAGRPTDRLIAGLQRHVDSHFAPPGMGYRASLTDVMVHRLDVAIPLGLEVDRPVESWRPVLDFLTSKTPMWGSIRRHRPRLAWRATDLAWSAGSGPVVSGPAEAVGLALCGRGAHLDRLEGPGVDHVRSWLEA